jgi:hypothetical protein
MRQLRAAELRPGNDCVTEITSPGKRPAYISCEAVRILPGEEPDMRAASMNKAMSSSDPDLPLELGGYEADTAQDVFVLTSSLDANLKHALERDGYLWRANIVLADGQVIDGWVKI